MTTQDLLVIIGGKKERNFIEPIITGVYESWSLYDIKKDGVSYNLFLKKTYSDFYWAISKIIEIDGKLKFDSFDKLDSETKKWLESEFVQLIRSNKLNKLL